MSFIISVNLFIAYVYNINLLRKLSCILCIWCILCKDNMNKFKPPKAIILFGLLEASSCRLHAKEKIHSNYSRQTMRT